MHRFSIPAVLGAAILLLAGCVSAGQPGDTLRKWSRADRTYEPTQLFYDLDTAASQLQASEQSSANDPYNAVPARTYLDDGVTLSNMACQSWLTALGKTDRDTQHAKNVLNIVGSLLLGLAGINGASSSSLAKGALGLTSANAFIDAYRADILQGVISEIEPKIRDARRLSVDAAYGTEAPKNYYAVRRYLVAYHATCSSNEIKRLLSASLKEVKYSFEPATVADAARAADAANQTADLFHMIFNESGTFSDDALLDLYGLLVAGATAETIGTPLPIATLAADKVAALGDDDAAKKEAVIVKLARIGAIRDLDSKLKVLIKEHADAVATAKENEAHSEQALKQTLRTLGASDSQLDTRQKLLREARNKTAENPDIQRYVEDLQKAPLIARRFRSATTLIPSIVPNR
jgi:hypothetical protein